MPRYSATFTFDASDFQSARELARDMRAALRDDSRSYADANTKCSFCDGTGTNDRCASCGEVLGE